MDGSTVSIIYQNCEKLWVLAVSKIILILTIHLPHLKKTTKHKLWTTGKKAHSKSYWTLNLNSSILYLGITTTNMSTVKAPNNNCYKVIIKSKKYHWKHWLRIFLKKGRCFLRTEKIGKIMWRHQELR